MTSPSRGRPRPGGLDRPAVDLVELLTLEQVELDLFRASAVFDDRLALYGGQVAAQALLAAAATVPDDRTPHSLHGYYLRGGDAARPTLLRVERDRDGRSVSARRVVAVQRGEVIFSMAASFQAAKRGPDLQVEPPPVQEDPGQLAHYLIPRLTSMDGRIGPQPYGEGGLPTRFWGRCTSRLPEDPAWHAAALTYLSDMSSGIGPLGTAEYRSGSSLDHALWFHRPVRMDDWVLLDLVPRTVADGRGWYQGTVHDRRGTLVASLTQEALFHPRERSRR
jgi:acyl-CoA thioesterase-2